jgi:hypothetical protein
MWSMKKMRKINWAILIAVSLTAGLMYSCEDDDDDNGDNGRVDPGTVASSNLIAYFPFDSEPAGGAAVTNSNNQITFVRKVGAASFVEGRRGNAFQGAPDSYLEYNLASGSAFTTLDEFSISCWLKTPVTTTGASKIFGINGGDPTMGNLALIQESQPMGDSVDLKLYLFDSASPEWKGQDIRADNEAFLNDKWFHLTALYRKATSTMEFWANGRRVFSQIRYAGPVPATGTQPLLEGITLMNDGNKIFFGAWPQQIAATPESWMTYFRGLVDEFRIYNKALSEDEIMDLYEAEVTQIEE